MHFGPIFSLFGASGPGFGALIYDLGANVGPWTRQRERISAFFFRKMDLAMSFFKGLAARHLYWRLFVSLASAQLTLHVSCGRR